MIDDGNTYEHDAIEVWLKKHNTSPVSNETLSSTSIMPNLTLKRMIDKFLEE